jgi:hypothetical protein
LRLVAVTAVNGAIAPRLEGHGGLLATTGADDGGTAGFAALVAATAATLVALSGLTTGFAAFRRGIAAFLEERLIFAGKGEFPTAVATGKLQISRHVSPRRCCTPIILYFQDSVNPEIGGNFGLTQGWGPFPRGAAGTV